MNGIDQVITKTLENGPDRVYAKCSCGCGKLVGRSPQECDVPSPAIIFIRRDGWSLGTPIEFIAEAEELWKDQWEAVLHVGSRVAKTYFQWAKSGFDSA